MISDKLIDLSLTPVKVIHILCSLCDGSHMTPTCMYLSILMKSYTYFVPGHGPLAAILFVNVL